MLKLILLLGALSFVCAIPDPTYYTPRHFRSADNTNDTWLKLARRVDFESHLVLPVSKSRFSRRFKSVSHSTLHRRQSPTHKESVHSSESQRVSSFENIIRSRGSIYNQRQATALHAIRPSLADRSPSATKDTRPTPAPTGSGSDLTSVHITSESDFALLLPTRQGGEDDFLFVKHYSHSNRSTEPVSEAEQDGESYCTNSSGSPCSKFVQPGFIRAAAVKRSPDNAWIQVTGCIDPSKSTLNPSDEGGQMDVRFPNGAQCTFGGYAASFIEL